ncbi:1-Cys peroxiredoxin [Ramicandelaber brevisporus]|nr:1-Cys peroxiredoxin [Ramicandelaber brevisporus]
MPNQLRLGSNAPNFSAETTQGPIEFYKWSANSWVVLFSHPADFTPVCTTELGEVARLEDKFSAMNVKVIGLSTNGLFDHETWVDDINELSEVDLRFPIIADADRTVATLYDMLDSVDHDSTNVVAGIPFTVRSVFVIDPAKKIRLIMTYPASCGRNFDELFRAVESLQLSDKHPVSTPAKWKPGDDVLINVDVDDGTAKKKFPGFKAPKSYLRFTPDPESN